MLEGLEITIVNKSKAFDPFFKARIDPEFFQKRYILMYSKILALHHDLISNIALVTDGEHGNAVTQTEGYSKYFGARNVLDGILNDNGVEYITKEHHEKLKKTALKPRDVLISCVGANIGFASIVPDNIGIGNIVRNVALIRSNTQINNEYLLAYFRSEYGKSLYYRMNTGNAQPLVSLDYINTIPIYKPSQDFQLAIKRLITNSLENNELSKQTYSSAEIYLLKIIGLNDFKLSDDPVNTKSFKDSFLATGRLDAEYYQKKYEEVVSHIKAQRYDRLSNLVTIKKSIEPGSDAYSDQGLPFMRVSDFNKLGLTEPDKKLSSAFCSDNAALIKKLKPKKETILFSKDGSVGTAYMLRKDEDLITSGAILHLTVKDKQKIIPEYLTLALNSKLVQMQAERDAGGSIILHWRIGEIENVVVPVIDYTQQEKIATLIEESFRLKKQSEQLLETAKRTVEIAIEQDEEAAMRYVEETQWTSI